MNCTKCKAQWTPPQNLVVTKCPFCGEQLFAPKIDGKPAEPYQVLLKIAQQFGSDTLGQSRLKGLLADMMPNAERRHLRILKQAVDDGIGARLLEMQSDTHAVRTLKITSLKENFRNNNAFNHTADYVVDCFQFALGWLEHPPKEDVNSAQVNTLNILQHTVEMAFTDGRLSKEEAKSIFSLGKTLDVPESEVAGLIDEKLKAQNFKPEKPIDQTLRSKKEIILSQDWVLKNEVKTQEEYESVKIGDQVWMKRNLDVSHFRNGDPIPEAKTNEEWEKADEEKKPAWCYYGNDPKNGKIYGKLYNWYAVNDPRGLAPEGWHVPSDNEWQVLVDYLGGKGIAGGKMKTTGTSEWEKPNEGATNNSGFSGLPGGYRTNGCFSWVGYDGFWWSSTESSYKYAWGRELYYNFVFVAHNGKYKSYGFSVRCVRDDAAISSITMLLNEEIEYEIIRIGDQEWMNRNLDVSHFRNGDPIPEARTVEEWSKAGEEGKPAWCYYNNISENGKHYGKLYNWFAVNNLRGLAPYGWKIPSDEEIKSIANFSGEEYYIGTELTSKDGWDVISNYFTALYEKMEATGNAVVTRIRDTKNPEIKTMFTAQLRDDVNSSEATKENTIFLGWGTGSRIIRALRSFKPSVFNAEVGTVLPDNVNIQVEDQVGAPFYDGQEPRKRPNSGTVITKNGEPIYRNTLLVAGEPVHTIISDFDRETTDTQYGVTAMPGGSRKKNGSFEFAVFGVMWSSCVESSGFAYACYFDPFSMKIDKVKVEKGYGFSVRCVKE